jgi:peptidoglycan/LPS O-acetylase OafA/YrhL
MQLWPMWVRVLVGWLVNATMSLPFGNYIGQLDGVYWSVCAEILFYLLYPRLFLPLFNLITAKKSWILNLMALISAGYFFYALKLISRHLLGLSLLQLELAIFFVLGMSISRFERSQSSQQLVKKINKIPGLFWSMLSLFLLVFSTSLWNIVLKVSPGIELTLRSISLSIVFFLTLKVNNEWSHWLKVKWMVLLGNVSYAVYLTHTLALEIFVKDGNPHTVVQTIIILIASIVATALLTVFVHFYLERPYILERIKTKPRNKLQATAIVLAQLQKKPKKIFVFTVLSIYLLLIWISY